MNFNLMVFLVVTVVLLTRMITKVMTERPPHQAGPDKESLARLTRLEESLARLDRRLKNVETIVTAKDFHLKEEFEDLERS